MINKLRKYWRRFWRDPRHEYFMYVIYYDVFNDEGNPLSYREWIKQEDQ